MANRISLSAYDKMRKSSLQSASRKRSREWPEEEMPSKKGKHGSKLDDAVKEKVLEQARTWSSTEKVKWAQLGRANQLKSFCNIPAAHIDQCEDRAPRRERIKFPMSRPIGFHRKKKSRKISKVVGYY